MAKYYDCRSPFPPTLPHTLPPVVSDRMLNQTGLWSGLAGLFFCYGSDGTQSKITYFLNIFEGGTAGAVFRWCCQWLSGHSKWSSTSPTAENGRAQNQQSWLAQPAVRNSMDPYFAWLPHSYATIHPLALPWPSVAHLPAVGGCLAFSLCQRPWSCHKRFIFSSALFCKVS